MTECGVGQVASRRPGGLDSRARAAPILPLSSCGYWEEQRSAVRVTAWGRCRRVLLSRPFSGWRLLSGRVSGARSGRAKHCRRSQGRRLVGPKIVRVFEFMLLTSAPGRIRTCAHGSGGCCPVQLWPAQTRSRASCPGAYRARPAGPGRRAHERVVPTSVEAHRPASGQRFCCVLCPADAVGRCDPRAGELAGR